ncbi:hypothetical protein Vadar_033185 [Vaccinium darrowii]|uniref:Uncharacterized protein n=1 Tax=Vaccinium darrowii TaxID=229202 RepID=A0ACB7YHU8_9ERIC|nr:hypothetical protein Vadar_033185 [Vaccinium darrowii]
MDESWRMRMGAPTRSKPKQSLLPRRSMEETSSRRAAVYGGEFESLAAEDFNDVFGGPPRTVLERQFSAGDFSKSSTNPFYEEVFRQTDTAAPVRRTGRNLPENGAHWPLTPKPNLALSSLSLKKLFLCSVWGPLAPE